MRVMQPLIIIVLLLLISLLCHGCYNRVELEDTVAAVAHGLDLSPDGTEVVTTGQFALPKPGSDEGAPKFLIRSAPGPTFSAAEQVINTSLPRTPVWSLAETFIIGENIAQRDISLFLDHLARVNAVREVSLLFLSYGCTPEQVLKVKTPLEDTAGAALPKMIRIQEPQIGLYSPVTINEFLFKVSAVGIEPVLPQLIINEQDGKQSLVLKGLAVFRGNRMVGTLDEQESQGYHLMQPTTRGGLIEINLSGASGGQSSPQTLEITDSRLAIEPQLNQDGLKMKISISVEGNLYELDRPQNLAELSQLGQFEQQGSEAIRQDIKACIDRAQVYQSDILGWGQLLQRQEPELWETLANDWPTQFGRIPYDINVDFNLRRTYLQGRGSLEQ